MSSGLTIYNAHFGLAERPFTLLPDPDLSERLSRLPIPLKIPQTRAGRTRRVEYLRALKHLFKAAEGRRRIPRSVRLAWP